MRRVNWRCANNAVEKLGDQQEAVTSIQAGKVGSKVLKGRVKRDLATNWMRGRGQTIRWLENTGSVGITKRKY